MSREIEAIESGYERKGDWPAGTLVALWVTTYHTPAKASRPIEVCNPADAGHEEAACSPFPSSTHGHRRWGEWGQDPSCWHPPIGPRRQQWRYSGDGVQRGGRRRWSGRMTATNPALWAGSARTRRWLGHDPCARVGDWEEEPNQ